MTGRPDAGPDGTTPRPTREQARFAAQRLRDHAEVARQLAEGGKVMGRPAWEAAEHERSAEAYERSAAELERVGGETRTERAL